MLHELRVRNLGVVEDVAISFGRGMTALTGETGAGKTLLVMAISLLMGGRVDRSMLRAGADEAVIEGRFAGVEGPGSEDEVVLARAIGPQRSRAWIDGRMVPTAVLAERAAALVELSGQHEHRALVTTPARRRALDTFGGIDLTEWSAARAEVRRLEALAEELGGSATARARQLDVLRYQLEEIRSAELESEDELERLAEEAEHLGAASEMREAVTSAAYALAEDGGPVDGLRSLVAALGSHAALSSPRARLLALVAEADDIAAELRALEDNLLDDPARLDAIGERRRLLGDLIRKYGTTLGEVLSFARDLEEEIAHLEGQEARATVIDGELAAAREALERAAAQVGGARRRSAATLGPRLVGELAALGLDRAEVEVRVEGADPGDDVEFLFSTNPGEPPRPIGRIASGGELSRTMLAMRLALSSWPEVMVFDEVDAGIGGTAARNVGAALARLGEGAQVLVVTHLPQVAACAHHQVRVEKRVVGGRTVSTVTALDAEGRVEELSRMLSGDASSESARVHARELLTAQSVPAAGGSASHAGGVG